MPVRRIGIHLVLGVPRRGGASETQSVMFLKSMWTVAQAKAWLRDHGYKYGHADASAPNTIRFRQQDPRRFTRFAMQPLGTSNPRRRSNPMSWRVLVKVPGEPGMTGNALRFATKKEAQAYGENLYSRWTSVETYKVVLSKDPVNMNLPHLGVSNPSLESVIPVKWAEAKVRQVAGKIQVMVFGKGKKQSRRRRNPGMSPRSRQIVYAAAQDAGNRSMRKAGRKAWSQEDYNVAAREFERLWPEEKIQARAWRGEHR